MTSTTERQLRQELADCWKLLDAELAALSRAIAELRRPLPAALDLHTPGIYVVLDTDGAPVLETLALTGYSARATFIREKNMLWSRAQEQGFRLAELRPV